MRFGTTILAAILGIIGIVVLLTVGVSSTVLESDARARLDEEMERVLTAFSEVRALSDSLLRARAEAVAAEPRLKAVVASSDIDRATLLDVTREMRDTLGLDVFIVADVQGRLRVDPAAPSAEGDALSALPGVADALQFGAGTGVWARDGHAYEVAVQRIAFGDEAVGFVAIGERIVDTVPATLHRQTGASIMLLLEGQPIAVAPASIDPGLVALAARATGEATGVVEGELPDGRYLMRSGPYAATARSPNLQVVVAVSLSRALATSRALSRMLLVVGAVAFLFAVTCAWWVARRLSGPVRQLADHTREIASGLLRTRPDLTGAVELVELGRAMNAMAGQLAESRQHLAAKERLEGELQIAAHIQTSILPHMPRVAGLDLAMAMVPATEVGGDYYDVVPCEDGCWIAIGDVAGHGVKAGMVMMMLQSAVGALAPMHPDATPSELTCGLNHVLYQNIRERMRQDEHVTFTLFRYRRDGTLSFSGAHEDVIVLRSGAATCELVPTRGTWLGITSDVSGAMENDALTLAAGDIVVLYTDGVTEAQDDRGRRFGLERLCAAIESARAGGPEGIRDHVMAAVLCWAPIPDDDVTLVALRHVGAAAEAA